MLSAETPARCRIQHYYNHWPDPELERHAKRMADLGEPIQEPFDR